MGWWSRGVGRQGDDTRRHGGDDVLHGDGNGFELVARAASEDGRRQRVFWRDDGRVSETYSRERD